MLILFTHSFIFTGIALYNMDSMGLNQHVDVEVHSRELKMVYLLLPLYGKINLGYCYYISIYDEIYLYIHQSHVSLGVSQHQFAKLH